MVISSECGCSVLLASAEEINNSSVPATALVYIRPHQLMDQHPLLHMHQQLCEVKAALTSSEPETRISFLAFLHNYVVILIN